MPRIQDHSGAGRRLAAGALAAAGAAVSCGGDAAGPAAACSGLEAGGAGAVARLSLAPGELCVLTAAEAANLELGAAAGDAEYLVAIQSASRVAGATASLSFEVEGTAPATPPAVSVAPAPRPPGPEIADLEWASRAEFRFRESAREALRGARPLRASAPTRTSGPRRSVAPASLATGDTIALQNSVDADLSVDCDGLSELSAVVQAIGDDIGILEDVEAAGAVSASDYAELLVTLEELVFPIDTAYFGAPADLDGNGVVWVLFTPIVNRVTPRGSVARVSGFFNPSDLSDPESCPASNRGEILYLLAADPDGRFSDPVDPSFATSRAVGIVAHELEHLIAAQRRVTLGGGSFADLEDAWLGEGLAHSAETAVGFAAAGLRPGENLDFAGLSAERESFDAYHFANFRRAGFHFLDPSGTLALGDDAGRDPGGVGSLRMRGFSWLLLRWLADRVAPAGGLLGGPAEERLFRRLAGGGPGRARGIDNLERASANFGGSGDWADLLAGYALAPLADDAVGDPAPGTQIDSFALLSIFLGLHAEQPTTDPFAEPYPLVVGSFLLEEETNGRIDFDLGASTARYVRMRTPPVATTSVGHPPVRLAVGTPAGGPVPASARVRLILHRVW